MYLISNLTVVPITTTIPVFSTALPKLSRTHPPLFHTLSIVQELRLLQTDTSLVFLPHNRLLTMSQFLIKNK